MRNDNSSRQDNLQYLFNIGLNQWGFKCQLPPANPISQGSRAVPDRMGWHGFLAWHEWGEREQSIIRRVLTPSSPWTSTSSNWARTYSFASASVIFSPLFSREPPATLVTKPRFAQILCNFINVCIVRGWQPSPFASSTTSETKTITADTSITKNSTLAYSDLMDKKFIFYIYNYVFKKALG